MGLLENLDSQMIETARYCSQHRINCHGHDQTKYLTEAEWQQLLQFAAKENTVTSITMSNDGVLAYLSDNGQLPCWRSVFSCMLYMHFNGRWDKQSQFVKTLIASAEIIMENVELIKRELEILDNHNHVLSALRLKWQPCSSP